MKAREGLQLFTSAFSRWNQHNAPRLGAAIAYYTLLSVAPLMIIAITICGAVFGQTDAERQVLHQARMLFGYNGAETLHMMINNTRHQSSGVIPTTIATITLLFGASGVLMELRDSLNTIWDVKSQSSSTWGSMIWQRIVSFGMVLGIGLLLLVSLLCSAAFQIMEKFFSGVVPISPALLEAGNIVVSLAAITLLFGLAFKYLPDASIVWKDVGIGAAVTAALFTIGKFFLTWYVSTAGVGSTYGAAGSLVAMVVWVYYSAQIFLFGAVFTRIYAMKYGSRSGQSAHAGQSINSGQVKTKAARVG